MVRLVSVDPVIEQQDKEIAIRKAARQAGKKRYVYKDPNKPLNNYEYTYQEGVDTRPQKIGTDSRLKTQQENDRAIRRREGRKEPETYTEGKRYAYKGRSGAYENPELRREAIEKAYQERIKETEQTIRTGSLKKNKTSSVNVMYGLNDKGERFENVQSTETGYSTKPIKKGGFFTRAGVELKYAESNFGKTEIGKDYKRGVEETSKGVSFVLAPLKSKTQLNKEQLEALKQTQKETIQKRESYSPSSKEYKFYETKALKQEKQIKKAQAGVYRRDTLKETIKNKPITSSLVVGAGVVTGGLFTTASALAGTTGVGAGVLKGLAVGGGITLGATTATKYGTTKDFEQREKGLAQDVVNTGLFLGGASVGSNIAKNLVSSKVTATPTSSEVTRVINKPQDPKTIIKIGKGISVTKGETIYDIGKNVQGVVQIKDPLASIKTKFPSKVKGFFTEQTRVVKPSQPIQENIKGFSGQFKTRTELYDFKILGKTFKRGVSSTKYQIKLDNVVQTTAKGEVKVIPNNQVFTGTTKSTSFIGKEKGIITTVQDGTKSITNTRFGDSKNVVRDITQTYKGKTPDFTISGESTYKTVLETPKTKVQNIEVGRIGVKTSTLSKSSRPKVTDFILDKNIKYDPQGLRQLEPFGRYKSILSDKSASFGQRNILRKGINVELKGGATSSELLSPFSSSNINLATPIKPISLLAPPSLVSQQIIEQDSSTKLKTVPISSISLETNSKFNLVPSTKLRTDLITTTNLKTNLVPSTKLRTDSITNTRLKTTPSFSPLTSLFPPKTVTTTTPTNITTTPPVTPPPITPPFSLFGGRVSLFNGKRRPEYIFSPKRQYRPTVRAVLFDIKGEASKLGETTGITSRPIAIKGRL